jgi:putative ATPase
VEHIGYPEARITLAHAALHIARAPKSNSAYRGINLAMNAVESERPIPVPGPMRDSHYRGAEALGAKGYLFPHDDPAGWVDQDHAPGVSPGDFYRSDARGGATFERRADDYWESVTGRPQPRQHGDG